MSTLVKKQHYVWQHYLKPWTHKGKIFCLRQSDQKLFCSGTNNVASETFFYRVERLSSDDIRYLEAIISKNVIPDIQEMHRETIKIFQLPFTLRDTFQALSGSRPLGKKLQYELDKAEKNVGEQYHTMTENLASEVLNQLYNMRSDFFSDDQGALNFLHYIFHQFFRTPKLRKISARLQNPYPNLDLNRTAFFESHIFADNLASHVFVNRSEYSFQFLINQSSVSFITGDQPVFNLNDPAVTNELKLFYSLSPSLAVIFFKDSQQVGNSQLEITSIEAEYYNQNVFSKSTDQIYGSKKPYLESFKSSDKNI